MAGETEQKVKRSRKSKMSRFTNQHPIFTALLVSIVSNILVFGIIAIITFYTQDLKNYFHDVPIKISKMDSVLTNLNSFVRRMEIVESYKPISAGIVYSKDTKSPIPNGQIIVVKHSNSPFNDIDKVVGKCINIKSRSRGMSITVNLLITSLTENPTDRSKDVDAFMNDEMAKILIPNPNVGKCNLFFRMVDEPDN